MLNLTVGPVQMNKEIRAIASKQIPYFRTSEFTDIMLENEWLMLNLSKAPEKSKAVFLTGSGTAAMEASVVNTLTEDDKALVVNGGSFGQRFVELLTIHGIDFTEIKVTEDDMLSRERLDAYRDKGYTAFLVNMCETSCGMLYDINMIGKFCEENSLFLIVDAVSSFIADEIDMKMFHIDVMITGSQKALACPPGISIIVLSPNGVNRVKYGNSRCMYLDLKAALSNQQRGQTPFTPAVGVLLQINYRLRSIERNGGIEKERERIRNLAVYFRERILELPFDIPSYPLSNAVTPLRPKITSAYNIFTILKDKYDIWVCPNGGELRDKLFRVGHIGCIEKKDYDLLIDALQNLINHRMI